MIHGLISRQIPTTMSKPPTCSFNTNLRFCIPTNIKLLDEEPIVPLPSSGCLTTGSYGPTVIAYIIPCQGEFKALKLSQT